MLRNKKFISIVCALALSTSLSAKDFNLEELINIALEHNTNIHVSKNTKDASIEELNKAKAGYLPKLSANASIGEYDIETAASKQDGNSDTVSLNASQLLYDFGKTTSSIDASKYNLQSSKSDIITKSQDTILSVKEAYYDILNKYQQINVAKEAVELDTLQLNQAQEYFKAGIRTKIDVTNAKLNLSNSQLDLVKADYALKIAKTKIISILGVDINESMDIKPDTLKITTLAKSIDLSNIDLDGLIKLGLEQRSELKNLESQVMVNKANMTNANSQYYPTLDLNASYTDQNSDDIASLESQQSTLTLNLKWDLYTGDTTASDKKISLANLSTAKKQLHQQKLQIRQDITDAYFNLRQSFDSIKISLLSLKLATENLDLANQRYQAGLNDLLEVNDAKLEYTRSKSSLVNTYYDHLTNTARLDYNLGR